MIRQIQEIRPFDELTINRAIEACQDSDGRYSMDQVLNVLMDDVSAFWCVSSKKNCFQGFPMPFCLFKYSNTNDFQDKSTFIFTKTLTEIRKIYYYNCNRLLP